MKPKKGDTVLVRGVKCVVMSVGRSYALVTSYQAQSFPTWVHLDSITL